MRASFRERPPWLARVGRVGAGVLIAPDLVLTCAHVATSDELPVSLVHHGHASSGRVEVRVPIADDDGGDLAVLRLTEPVPNAVVAPLRAPAALSDHDYLVQGFAADRHTESRGKLGGRVGPGWVQLDGTSGQPVDQGFSGAPVWDDTIGAVVGIVVMAQRSTRWGALIPVEEIVRLWPEAVRYTGWRLDLDDAFDTHWLPRARGVEPHEPTDVWHFVGRHRALDDLATYLREPGDGRVRAVIGTPGSGKSAVLARTVVLADRITAALVPPDSLSPDVSLPPVGSVTVAVHARGRTLPQVVRAIADAAEVEAADQVRLVQRCGPITVVLDALDEAAGDDPVAIATMLNRLASDPKRHVIVGTRVGARGSTTNILLNRLADPVVLDLDSPAYLDHDDVVRYAERRLGDRTGAAAIADRAKGNFLIAQLAAMTALSGGVSLATTVGMAVDEYLDVRFERPRQVRELLLPLAFAQGAGLTEGPLWLALANALSVADHTPRDLREVLRSAASYLVEQTGRHYRLFHQALDDTFREEHGGHEPEQVVYRTLRGLVTTWADAPDYIRTHLAAHAVAAGRLDELVEDLGFMVAADPERIIPHLPHVTTDRAKLIRHVYRRAAHGFHGDTGHRAAYFCLVARQTGCGHLADEVTERTPWQADVLAWAREDGQQVLLQLPMLSDVGLWLDAHGNPAALADDPNTNGDVVLYRFRDYRLVEADRLTLSHGYSGFRAHVHRVTEDGREFGLTVDGDGVLHRWSFTGGLRMTGAVPLGPERARWDADAVATPDGRLLAVIAHQRVVHVVDWTADQPKVLHWFEAGSATEDDGKPGAAIAVHAGEVHVAHFDGLLVRLRVLRDGVFAEVGEPVDDHRYNPAVVRFVPRPDGTLLLLSASGSGLRRSTVSDGGLTGTEPVRAQPTSIASAVLPNGRVAVAAGVVGGDVAVFDVTDGLVPLGEPRRAHRLSADEVVVGIGPWGKPVVLSYGHDRHVRMWDLDHADQAPGEVTELPELFYGTVHLALVDGTTVVAAMQQYDRLALIPVTDRLTVGGTEPYDRLTVTAVGRRQPLAVTGDESGRLDVWRATATGPEHLAAHELPGGWKHNRAGDVVQDDEGLLVVLLGPGDTGWWWLRHDGTAWHRTVDPIDHYNLVEQLLLYRSAAGRRALVIGDRTEILAPGARLARLTAMRSTDTADIGEAGGEPVAVVGGIAAFCLYSLAADDFVPWSKPWQRDLDIKPQVAVTFPTAARALVAAGSNDGRLWVWSCARGGSPTELAVIRLDKPIRALIWTDDRELVVWCEKGVVKLAGFG